MKYLPAHANSLRPAGVLATRIDCDRPGPAESGGPVPSMSLRCLFSHLRVVRLVGLELGKPLADAVWHHTVVIQRGKAQATGRPKFWSGDEGIKALTTEDTMCDGQVESRKNAVA